MSGELLLGHSNFWVSPRDCLGKCCLASAKVISRSPLAAYRHGGQSVGTEKCPAHTPCDKALIETSQQTHFCQTAPGPFPGESGSLSLEFRLRLDWEWRCETWLEEKKKYLLLILLFSTQQENLKTAHFICFVSGVRGGISLCSKATFKISKYIRNQKYWLSTVFTYNQRKMLSSEIAAAGNSFKDKQDAVMWPKNRLVLWFLMRIRSQEKEGNFKVYQSQTWFLFN